MVVNINSNSSSEEIRLALQKLHKGNKQSKKKHFDAHQYCGVIKLKEDPIAIQKKMRDEWD